MEQEVRVQLTLSVDAKDSKELVRDRLKSLIEFSGDMTITGIELQEESEIYNTEDDEQG